MKSSQQPEATEKKAAEAEAKLDALQRTISVVLEKHDSVKAAQAKELADIATLAKEALDGELSEVRLAIKEARDTLKSIEDTYEIEVSKHVAELKELTDAQKTTEYQTSVSEVTNNRLNTENLRLESELEVNQVILDKVKEDLTQSQDKLTAQNEANIEASARQVELEAKLSKLEEAIIDTDNHFTQIRADGDRVLNELMLKTDQKKVELAEIQKIDEDTRRDLAKRIIELDKREDTLVTREARVKQEESRVFNYVKRLEL